jgi:hypothetical protein
MWFGTFAATALLLKSMAYSYAQSAPEKPSDRAAKAHTQCLFDEADVAWELRVEPEKLAAHLNGKCTEQKLRAVAEQRKDFRSSPGFTDLQVERMTQATIDFNEEFVIRTYTKNWGELR